VVLSTRQGAPLEPGEAHRLILFYGGGLPLCCLLLVVSAVIVDHVDELLSWLLGRCLHGHSLGYHQIRHHVLADLLLGESGHPLVLRPVHALHASGQVLKAPSPQGVYALIVLDAWVVQGGCVEQRQLGSCLLVHRQAQLFLSLREVVVLLALTFISGCCLGEAQIGLKGCHEIVLLGDGAAPVHVLNRLLLQPITVIIVHLRKHRIRPLLLILHAGAMWGTPRSQLILMLHRAPLLLTHAHDLVIQLLSQLFLCDPRMLPPLQPTLEGFDLPVAPSRSPNLLLRDLWVSLDE